MRFVIRAFEGDNTPPVEGARKVDVNEAGKVVSVWMVDFNTMEDLMHFAGQNGPIVIKPGFPPSIVLVNS